MRIKITMSNGATYFKEFNHSNFSEACLDITIRNDNGFVFIKEGLNINWKQICSIEEIEETQESQNE